MVRKFPPFRSERKKRSTSEGTPQFPNGISGKLPYHLTSNRNFRIFWPNGKHPGCLPFGQKIRKFRFEVKGAYHLAKKSGNFGLKSNSKVIFRKFRSEIVEYLQRYSSLSVRNGTTEISLPFAKLCSFQSLISRKQLRKIEVQMVSAISFGWFADFGKTLTIIQRSSQPVYSDKW